MGCQRKNGDEEWTSGDYGGRQPGAKLDEIVTKSNCYMAGMLGYFQMFVTEVVASIGTFGNYFILRCIDCHPFSKRWLKPGWNLATRNGCCLMMSFTADAVTARAHVLNHHRQTCVRIHCFFNLAILLVLNYATDGTYHVKSIH